MSHPSPRRDISTPDDALGGGRAPAPQPPAHARMVVAIIRAYDSLVVRLYCLVRFRIIRGRFLEEIGQFLPREGRIFEVGCGFGLFGLYFARAAPTRVIHGVDVSEKRIALAERARRRLGAENISFSVGDARSVDVPDGVDACYVLDLLHHLPRASARGLLTRVHDRLRPGGVLVVKEVATRPRYKMAFTWLLDVLMTRGDRPLYWAAPDLAQELRDAGFTVFHYAMVDVLPYPHVLYVCEKPR